MTRLPATTLVPGELPAKWLNAAPAISIQEMRRRCRTAKQAGSGRTRSSSIPRTTLHNIRNATPVTYHVIQRIVRIKAVPRARVYGRPLIGRRSPSPTAAGIYALMSFTVAQRTREIGIRTALGAPPRRLMLTVCGRAAWQVAVGVAVRSVLSAGAFMAIGVGVLRATPLLLAVAAIMAVVALLATLGPARRGVRIPAMEALRADA